MTRPIRIFVLLLSVGVACSGSEGVVDVADGKGMDAKIEACPPSATVWDSSSQTCNSASKDASSCDGDSDRCETQFDRAVDGEGDIAAFLDIYRGTVRLNLLVQSASDPEQTSQTYDVELPIEVELDSQGNIVSAKDAFANVIAGGLLGDGFTMTVELNHFGATTEITLRGTRSEKSITGTVQGQGDDIMRLTQMTITGSFEMTLY